jgi:hypothetical protein
VKQSLFKYIIAGVLSYVVTVRKFLGIVPGRTLAIVLVSLVSQAAILVAFLLPIKVVLLLGDSGVPGYFPQVLRAVGRDALVFGLSIAAVLAFIVFLLSDKFVSTRISSGAKYIRKVSRKTTLYSRQAELAERAYRDYVKSLAGIVFSMAAFALIVYCYFNLAILFLCYVLMATMVITICYQFSPYCRKKLDMKLNEAMGVFSAAGFLFSFSFIVADYLTPLAPPNLIFALLGLILMRQLLGSVSSVVSSVASLHRKRMQINSFFFRGHVGNYIGNKSEQQFWALMAPGQREKWVTSALEEVIGIKVNRLDTTWRQTGIRNVAGLEVIAYTNLKQAPRKFLVKLFDENRNVHAINETAILAECDLSSISLEFLGAVEIERYHCHVFAWDEVSTFPVKDFKGARMAILGKLMAYAPPEELIERYSNSHPYLWQRLNENVIYRLRNVASSQQMGSLSRFENNYKAIASVLRELPVQIFVPKIPCDSLVIATNNEPKLISWGEWVIDTIGIGWPTESQNDELLSQTWEEIRPSRSDLINVSEKSVRLSSLMHEFERSYSSQDYNRSLELIAKIVRCVDS